MAIEYIFPHNREITYPAGRSPDTDILERNIREGSHMRRIYPEGEFNISPEKWDSHRVHLLVHEDASATLLLQALSETTGVATELAGVADKFKRGGYTLRLPYEMRLVALLGNILNDPREYLFGMVLHLPYINPQALIEEIIEFK